MTCVLSSPGSEEGAPVDLEARGVLEVMVAPEEVSRRSSGARTRTTTGQRTWAEAGTTVAEEGPHCEEEGPPEEEEVRTARARGGQQGTTETVGISEPVKSCESGLSKHESVRSLIHVQNLPQTCLDLFQTCSRPVPDLFQTCSRPAPNRTLWS